MILDLFWCPEGLNDGDTYNTGLRPANDLLLDPKVSPTCKKVQKATLNSIFSACVDAFGGI